jgi:3-deoxy-manno-octulosonate cytidylyltransferase (CMP-KDO synthetase)
VRTSSSHRTGTERCAEAARILELDLVVNVQADEPFVDPRDIEAVLQALGRNPRAEMATLRIPLRDQQEYLDPNVVKVVSSSSGLAMYFSRAPIPYDRDNSGKFRGGHRHIGVYGYRMDFLLAFAATTPLVLEEIEKLEQLRALDMGARIVVVDARGAPIGIDTAEDLERARAQWRAQHTHGRSRDAQATFTHQGG